MSKFNLLVDYINQHTKFTRRQIFNEFKAITIYSDSTESQYINLIKNAGFIKNTGRGKYERVIFIPKNINTSQMRNIAYDSELQKKYMRKEKLRTLKSKN